jgi:hypothetical protein
MRMDSLVSIFKSARPQYEAAQYPGDLAVDILYAGRRWRWVGWAAAAVAVAALVGMALLLRQPQSDDLYRTPIAMNPNPGTNVDMAAVAPAQANGSEAIVPQFTELPALDSYRPEAPQWPENLVMVPPAQSLLVPTVPSFWYSPNEIEQ